MHPDTHLVIQLQSLDQKMSALEKEVAALPKHIAVIEKTLESHIRKLEADKAALAANQKERKKLEAEIQMHHQKISKLRDQMMGAKTNEQYRAFQHEIEFVREGNPPGRGSHSGTDDGIRAAGSERQEGRSRAEGGKAAGGGGEDRARKRTAEDQTGSRGAARAAQRSFREAARRDAQASTSGFARSGAEP